MLKFKQIREATKYNPYAIGMAVAKKKAGLGAAPAHDLPKSIITKGHEIAKKIKANEDFDADLEQIDELSKTTLGSYVKKASHDARMMGQIAGDFENRSDKARKQSKRDSNYRLSRKYLERAWKRDTGIGKAVDKLTKEENQVDEASVKPEVAKGFPAPGVKTIQPKHKYSTMPKDKQKAKGMPAGGDK